ncbi:class I SAM-dependent methyltransferase [Mesobacillus sp. AQ2]|uniref:class I SAM-dependent methyltransferase n=1 Tax=unclassified Mesobacillus TaxID=2675270 RepID=UPI00203A5677|nr:MULTISPECIES: class I SAM-dependent methyltransferase [unclassified Mesobacillus]MCM3121889.1 class I SAM-dependent methyltransferase [Mesobacillus sp. MER 33]MCM3231853.1 class I SAM-dependent methyltransferase [Mesobacillus sp. MER 48]WHX38820.1 class I SAM-dependent methyltransferase [Mesobacillus sp. AQ2]
MGNSWHERFGTEQYVYGEEPNQFIKEQAHRLGKGSKIVAFAEGEGRNAVYLALQGHIVTAYDYAENGLNKTNALAERHKVKISTELKNLIHDGVPAEEFDAAFMVFGHFSKDDQKTVMDKLISTVKPGGTIMFEVYSEDQVKYGTGGPKTVEMLYDPSDVLEWIKGYKVLHFFYGEQERVEGELHTGTGHVIQVIIKKNAN